MAPVTHLETLEKHAIRGRLVWRKVNAISRAERRPCAAPVARAPVYPSWRVSLPCPRLVAAVPRSVRGRCPLHVYSLVDPSGVCERTLPWSPLWGEGLGG